MVGEELWRLAEWPDLPEAFDLTEGKGTEINGQLGNHEACSQGHYTFGRHVLRTEATINRRVHFLYA